MFCNQCGNQLQDDATFCPVCGAKQNAAPMPGPVPGAAPTPGPVPAQAAASVVPGPVPGAAPTPGPVPAQAAAPMPGPVPGAVPAQAPKNPDSGKKLLPFLLGGIGVIVLLILVVVVVSKVGGGLKGITYNPDNMVFYHYGTESFYNLQGDSKDLDEELYDWDTSADGSLLVYLTYEDNQNDLYYTTDDLSPVLIDNDVYRYWISFDGAYVAYLADMDDYNEFGDLYLYCVKDGKSTKVDKEVYCSYVAISPNGKTVAYLKDYESYNDNVLYVGGVNRDPEKIDKDGCYPVCISNDGKYVYYVTESDKFYVYNGKESVKIASDIDYDFFFTADASSVIYEKGEKTYYYKPKMSEPVKLTSCEIYSVVLPDSVVEGYCGNYAYICGIKSFAGCVINTENGLYWINDKITETVKISSAYQYQISNDGKSLLYLSGGDVYLIKSFGNNMNPRTVYSGDYVDYFVAGENLSQVYVAIDDELYYVKGEKKLERISNDLESDYYYSTLVYSDALGKILFIENGTLYSAEKTAKSKKTVADDVDYISTFLYGVHLNGVVYSVEDGDEDIYYFMNSKKTVELLTED